MHFCTVHDQFPCCCNCVIYNELFIKSYYKPGWYSEQRFHTESSLGGTLVGVSGGKDGGRLSLSAMIHIHAKLDLRKALGAEAQ